MMNNQNSIPKKISKRPVLMMFASFMIFFLCISPIRAENVITGGTTVRINSGVFITSAQNVVVENGGKLMNEGTLILKNNFANQNMVDDIGIGTIEFSGTAPQSLSGQNTFGSLTLNNPTGLDINGNTTVNTELALQNGHIRLGTSNLTLGNMATISGTPSASAMIIATGTGELWKSFSGTSSFTYPVGDDSEIAEYSPVTLSFTSGTFAAENYVGVKLTNSAYPGYSVNGLNRYWSLAQNGITESQYDAVFQYVTADINGNESDLSCAMVEPKPIVSYNPANTNLHQLTANGLATFGVFTGISTMIIQDISLNTGWNIISANVTPANLNLKDLFQTLIDAGSLKKVMDESGKTIENFGSFGGWKNTIGNLNPIKGYKVIVTAPSTLSLEGVPVPLPMNIALNTGWNIISYPTSNLQDAKEVIQALIDAGKLKKVMDESGKTIENFGSFGGWKNNIGNFAPNKGYKVNVTENCTLTIPATGTKAATLVPEVLASTHFTKVFQGNGTDHANIHLVNIQASGLVAGDEIGVFDGENCVGSATIGAEQLIAGSISIPASSNDGLSENINGFTSRHPIELQLYRGSHTYQLSLIKISGNELFEKNGSLFAQVNTDILNIIQITEEPTRFKIYPNPTTGIVNLEISEGKVEKTEVLVTSLVGVEVFRKELTNDAKLQIDLSNQVNGIYLIKVFIGNQQYISKIVLRKE